MHNFIKLFLASAITLVFVAEPMAMPPLKGDFEPSYPTGVNAPPAELVNRDDANLEGEWNCLVILIDFPDYTWDNRNDSNFANDDRVYTQELFRNMLFSEDEFAHPGSRSELTGSMRDYYSEVSGGMFTTAGVVTRWYRAPENYSYYCNADGEIGTEDDFGFGEYPQNAQGLAETAVQLADEDVDFSLFDNDDDDLVDALFIIHAGPGAEEFGDAGASYIWSHQWQIPFTEVDGVTAVIYTIEPENGTIGVFCHEFGHALGLPDLYDTDGSSNGIGEWCLMAGGGWNARPGDPGGTCPAHMCGWAKMQLEWVNVIDVAENVEGLTILPVVYNPEIYRVWRSDGFEQEYFLLENRRRLGFDAGLTRRQIEYDLPAPDGLLILHIDDAQINNEDDAHRWVDVEEASPVRTEDGGWFEHLDRERYRPNDRSLYNPNRGDDGDLWPGYAAISDDSTTWSGNRIRSTFGITSIPSSADYEGNPTLVEIKNIRSEDMNVVCDISNTAPEEPLLTLGEIEISDGEDGNGIFEPGEVLTVIPRLKNLGQNIAEGVTLQLIYQGEHHITIEPNGSVAYPDLDQNEEGSPMVPFNVTIFGDVPPDAVIHLTGVAECGDALEFPVQITITLGAAGDWMKFRDNPVLTGTAGEWDAGGIGSFDIIDYGDSLVAYYIGASELGFMGVGRAVSTDFGESWFKYPEPVIPAFEQNWAAGGAIGLAVIGTRDGLVMLICADDAEETSSIGKAVSEDGFEWSISENPVISAGGWCASIFPLGQIDLIQYGAGYACLFSGFHAQGFVAMGAAWSANLENWQIDRQPSILPTFSAEDFDAYMCFSPDMLFGRTGVQLTYCGITEDFVSRIGLMNVIDVDSFERIEGSETGGSSLEPDEEGWEAGGMMVGSRLFDAPDGRRMLYLVMADNTTGIGLAVESPEQKVIQSFDDSYVLIPKEVQIGSAYPNPFNSRTIIPFSLKNSGRTQITVFDLIGREILSLDAGILSSGAHSFVWETKPGCAAGLYFVEVSTPVGKAIGTVLLLK